MLPNSWRRLLSLIRILLGMSCLAVTLISSGFVWTDRVILFAVYVIYACVALFWIVNHWVCKCAPALKIGVTAAVSVT